MDSLHAGPNWDIREACLARDHIRLLTESGRNTQNETLALLDLIAQVDLVSW